MEKVQRFPIALAVAGLVLALGVALAAGPPEAPAKNAAASKSKQKPRTALKGLYNARYCEILGVNQPDDQEIFEIEVYNTIGINQCPGDKWEAIDLDAVADARGWWGATRNGPRYWILDQIRGARPPAPENFGDLPMRRVATLRLPTLTQPDFTPIEIERRTQYVFGKGRYIRLLIDPEGNRYVMQAYTTNVDRSLTEGSLNRIGSNPLARIPEGWTFRARKLKRPLILTANGSATILRDGLRSVYQLIK